MTGLPIRLIHLSDVHFGSEDVEALQAVESFVARTRPDAVLVSGDLTQKGRRREFAAARTWFDSLDARVVVTPGNHDTPLLHMPARAADPFGRYMRTMAGLDALDQLVELGGGGVRLCALNTARGMQMRLNWADGVVSHDELDAALDGLDGGPTSAWRILLYHHPLTEPRDARIRVSTRRGAHALQRAAAANVDLVLTGHTHDAFAHPMEANGRTLVQMGAGTLSTRLRSSPPAFCVLELDNGRVTQDIIQIEGAALKIHRNYDSASAAPAG
jgi:3',5'-cyclic AMP phosphodiesterase CpdA